MTYYYRSTQPIDTLLSYETMGEDLWSKLRSKSFLRVYKISAAATIFIRECVYALDQDQNPAAFSA